MTEKDTTKEPKECFVYTRVSTERQAEEGYSLDAQERSCAEYAKKLGYKVLNVYREEGESGTSMNRPRFKEMLDRCSDDNGKTIKVVIVIHTDRFARNTLEHLMIKGILQKSGVTLLSVLQPMIDDSPEGNLMDILLAGMNEFYSKDLGRKVSRALAEKIKGGSWPGRAPTGYENISEPEAKFKRIGLDPGRADYIKEAFEKFATGKYTVRSLNDELYREGFRAKYGKKMAEPALSRLLNNIFYTGKMKYKNQIYQGEYPPLVDMETYAKVQKILDLHNHGANRSRKYRFLLSGLLFCKECGSRLIGEKHVKRSGLIFDYYRCMGPKREERNCRQPSLSTQDIEKKVAGSFKNISLSDVLLAGLKFTLEEIYKAQNQKDNQWLKTLENRRDGILKRMSKLEELLLEGIIAKERVVEKYQPLKDELDAMENQIEQNKISGRKLKKEDIDKIVGFLKTPGNTYLRLPEPKKKLFLKLLISKILIKNKEISKIIYTPVFQMIADKDLVRISTEWRGVRELIRTIESLINASS